MANSRDLRLEIPSVKADESKVENGIHTALITNEAATRKQLIPILVDFLRSQKAGKQVFKPTPLSKLTFSYNVLLAANWR